MVLSVNGSNGAATWAAGGTTPQQLKTSHGLAMAYNRKPKAALSSATTQVGDLVTIDASGSSDHDGDALSYLFDLDGDGVLETPSPGPTTSTAYSTEGDRVIGVEVRDGNGGVGATTALLHVLARVPVPTTQLDGTPPPDPTPEPPGAPLPTPPPESTAPHVPGTVT